MKKVLVVDDTKNIRMILTKCLELEGYEVMTASDGKQALELFTTHTFDLAFLDIKLPEIRGTEVLKRIRKLGINTPVIIITAYATVNNAVVCTNLGAVAYVQKPFSAEKIKSVLNEMSSVQCAAKISFDVKKGLIEIEDAINKKSYNTAVEMLKKAISAEPTNLKIYLLFYRAYQGLGDNEQANKFYAMYEALNAAQQASLPLSRELPK